MQLVRDVGRTSRVVPAVRPWRVVASHYVCASYVTVQHTIQTSCPSFVSRSGGTLYDYLRCMSPRV